MYTYVQCLICKCRGPGTKRGDGSGMWLEEGEVTGHSRDHIGGPFYIYIYAFSRRFYPKRLTVHSGYTYGIVSMFVPQLSSL